MRITRTLVIVIILAALLCACAVAFAGSQADPIYPGQQVRQVSGWVCSGKIIETADTYVSWIGCRK
jgi:hypothetical protein